MQDDVFDLLKYESEEKAAINIQVPAKLKRNFMLVCKFKGVTVTSALNKFMELSVDNMRIENLGYESDLVELED